MGPGPMLTEPSSIISMSPPEVDSTGLKIHRFIPGFIGLLLFPYSTRKTGPGKPFGS